MDKRDIKYIVFLLLVVLAILALFLAVVYADFFFKNALWLIALLLFILIVWKTDLILPLNEYEKAVVFRFGRLSRVAGPGWIFILPIIETAKIVDLRVKTIDIPKQDVITKENVELQIDAVIYIKVKNDKQSIINSVIAVDDFEKASRLYTISIIRNIVGSMTLSELISNIGTLNKKVKTHLEDITKEWGLEIVATEIKDIDVPRTILDAIDREMAAARDRQARIELAEAHKAEIEAVKKAAESLSDDTLAYFYIRALEKLGEGKSTKIIFPMELSNLAKSLSKAKTETQIEKLLRKYKPLIDKINKEEN